ncbi:GXWXG domain-containing protein [Streptomyces sp. STR69]|uniref:GXWXG domain-containing protein n=1 Tax=Streptomyces sp. STR69 TaxID=1796942 RepID=UPI0039678A08
MAPAGSTSAGSSPVADTEAQATEPAKTAQSRKFESYETRTCKSYATGHPLNGQLEQIRWHGKRFVSVTDVKPLICRDARGELFSTIEPGKGEPGLWNVEGPR